MKFEKLHAGQLHLEAFFSNMIEGHAKLVISTGRDDYFITVQANNDDPVKEEIEEYFLKYLGTGRIIPMASIISACIMAGTILAQTDISAKICYRENNKPCYGDIDLNDYFSCIRQKIENMALEDVIDSFCIRV